MPTLKEKIYELQGQGKNRQEISDLLDCSKSTIAYHLSISVKEKARECKRKWKRKNTLADKIHKFKHPSSIRRPFGTDNRAFNDKKLQVNTLKSKFGPNPVCYITGDPIDLENSWEYSLDHILPISKGGLNTLENCGLATRIANQVKTNLTYDELILFCEKVLNHHKIGRGAGLTPD